MPIKDLTSWHITGELWCPDCGEFFDFDGTPAELTVFIEAHTAACGTVAEGERTP